MNEKNYAFIKGNEVVNVVVFDDPSESLLNNFKTDFELDQIILANDNSEPGGTYDGVRFWRKQPYPSWLKNEELNKWEAPTPYPSDGKIYEWDEASLSWFELTA